MSTAPTTPHVVRRTVSAVAAGLLFTVGVSSPGQTATTVANGTSAAQAESDPIVIGTGPKAVYVGPAPTFGADPARGETEESYFARTGRHLPGSSTAVAVDGPWWYGRAPVTGGDPASGETDDSYFARTGRHLPAQ